ncbi:hypothetical protein [Breoghania sp.]|uniref:hypothetical protein n=1 Tax=Breoghania sp. TaxID=2065378 RepID=UPI002AAB15E0|nr:hypothetical protein [Breoghania sp.]
MMRLTISGRMVGALSGALCLGALAGCGSFGVSDKAESVGKTFVSGGGTTESPIDPSIFASQAYCPPIEVRADTYILKAYARGKQDDPDGLQYQATIRKYARECNRVGDNEMTIKVGVSGRVVAGPAPTRGPVVLPLRIAVTSDDNKVLASQLVPVEIGLAEAGGSAAWTRVVEDVRVPIEGASRVYVGFDNGSKR